MPSLFDQLSEQLTGSTLETISGRLGADHETTEKAVPAALGALVAALAGNSARGGGAEALLGALDKDHDGSVLDDLSGFLSRAEQGPGEGILRHVLGGKRASVEAGLGQATGLDATSVARLLTMLAPIVMGALGRERRRQGFDAGALASMLGSERATAERRSPVDLGVLGGLLDRDGDGQIGDDVAELGGGLLKSFLGRR